MAVNKMYCNIITDTPTLADLSLKTPDKTITYCILLRVILLNLNINT